MSERERGSECESLKRMKQKGSFLPVLMSLANANTIDHINHNPFPLQPPSPIYFLCLFL